MSPLLFVRFELTRIYHNSSPSSNKLNKVVPAQALLEAVHPAGD
jgi:hypothetical protein